MFFNLDWGGGNIVAPETEASALAWLEGPDAAPAVALSIGAGAADVAEVAVAAPPKSPPGVEFGTAGAVVAVVDPGVARGFPNRPPGAGVADEAGAPGGLGALPNKDGVLVPVDAAVAPNNEEAPAPEDDGGFPGADDTPGTAPEAGVLPNRPVVDAWDAPSLAGVAPNVGGAAGAEAGAPNNDA